MCGGCKTVGYIGKEEQKDHWPEHKKLCKALCSIRGKGLSPDQVLASLREKLGRSLTQYEMDIAHFPRVCMVCGCDDFDKLKNCKNCFCVAFCPSCLETGKLKHEADQMCTQLATAAEDYKNEQTLGHQVQNYIPKTIKGSHVKLPDNIEMFFVEDVNKIVSNKLPGYQESELRYLTFLYTCPLTTLFGAEAAGKLPNGEDLSIASSLTIHLVGSRVAEMRHLTGWEIIAHRLPKLKTLTFVFIGDECPLSEFPKDFTYKSKEIQTERGSDLTIRYQLCPKLYQDYATAQSFIKPDLVVALDCGFKFYPSWIPAIKQMLKYPNVPLIFTEFTLADQKDNLDIVTKNAGENLEVIVPPRRNPYTSRRPVRCSDKTGNYKSHSVIYTNDYICVVRKGL